MRGLICAAAIALPLAPALADPTSNDPYLYTCADLMAAQAETGGEAKVRANLMLMWSLGYMYGRFGGGPDGVLRAEGFDSMVTDMANAFGQICPNVPEMPIGEFATRLAEDLGAAVAEEETP